jgi:hypothetical protein
MIVWLIHLLNKRSLYIIRFCGACASQLAFAWGLTQHRGLRVVLPDLWTVCKLKTAALGSYSSWHLQPGLQRHQLRRAWLWQQRHVLRRWSHFWQLVKQKVVGSSEPCPLSLLIFFCGGSADLLGSMVEAMATMSW